MKIISYSLFNSNCQPFEKAAYLRGFWLNCRMNRFLFPEWRTHLNIERPIYEEYKEMFDWLSLHHSIGLTINDNNPPLCEGMIQRMRPIFTQDVSHVLCRDSDSLTTYREALAVQEWLESGKACLALHDNPGHDGLMGGMVGFDSAQFKAITGYQSWEQLIDGYDLSERGSDQHLMNGRIGASIFDSLLFIGGRNPKQLESIYSQKALPQVPLKFWESNLCISFIGAAGVNELETIRFLKRVDEYDYAFLEIENKYPKLFNWPR